MRIISILPGRINVPVVAMAVMLLAGVTACGNMASASGSKLATVTPMPMDMPMSPTVPNATPVATTSVGITNFTFGPQVIVVPVGSTVTWTNQDIEQHTVTALDKSFSSDALNRNQTFTFTFSKPGTYQYECLIHPQMRGTVVVQ